MKKIIIRLADSFIKTPAGKVWLRGLSRFYEFFRYRNSLSAHAIANNELKDLFSDLTVRLGFFKGLKYPTFESFGSSLYPKLSGNYECELFQTFEKFTMEGIPNFIDIGCAEGYYAVGVAKAVANCHVIAFDIDENARELCTNMAKCNGVSDWVEVKVACSDEWLGEQKFADNTLILCDCEGFEFELFTPANIPNLKNCNLIIEMHPFINRKIKPTLTALFKETHNITIVSSKDDKRKIFDLNETYLSLTPLQKNIIVQEGRPFTMDWLIATSKQSNL